MISIGSKRPLSRFVLGWELLYKSDPTDEQGSGKHLKTQFFNHQHNFVFTIKGVWGLRIP